MKRTRVSAVDISFKRALGDVEVGLIGQGVHGIFATAADEFASVAMATTGGEAWVSNKEVKKQRRNGWR